MAAITDADGQVAHVVDAAPGATVPGLVVHVASQPSGGAGLTDAELRASPVPVSGTVSVVEPVSVDGTVSVGNFPASQAVTGSFWQATQPVSHAGPTVASVSTFAASTSDAVLVASNASRKGLTVYNDNATAVLYLRLGTVAATSSVFTVKIAAGGYFELPPVVYTGEVHGVWSAAVGNGALVTEMT